MMIIMSFMALMAMAGSKAVDIEGWRLRGIHRDDYNAASYGRDYAIFRNGERSMPLGYKVEKIGELSVPGKPPVTLFRADDCHECEPGKELLFFYPGMKEPLRTLLPGEGWVKDPETEFKEVSRSVRGFLGECLASGKKGVLILKRERTPKKNNKGKWEFSPWTASKEEIEITADGKLKRSILQGEFPEPAISGKCKAIPGEDTSDYL